MTGGRFSAEERLKLLQIKGVGPKVVERLEQMGFCTLEQLAEANPSEILSLGATLSGSTCWKNSPQAKAAVDAAVVAALDAVHSRPR
jgi:predicted RecB family nuclease